MRSDYFMAGSLFLFFWIAVMTFTTAQYNPKDFAKYTVRDGLSDNNISCIVQDSRGYIWIGTEIGLNRFDGNQFKNSYQGYSGHVLPSSHIRKLIVSAPGKLIIVTTNGFQLLNTSDGSFRNYAIEDSTPFVTLRNLVWDLEELEDGSFAATTSSGFYVFNPDGSLAFRHDAYELKDIGKKRIYYGREILPVSRGQLIMYVDEMKMAQYQVKQKTFKEISHADTEWKDFFHPMPENGGPWNSKNQISDHEYIFLPKKDSIIYYNYAERKRVSSFLPFRWIEQLTWESKVTMLDDSTFTVNGGYAGLYLFHLDRQTGKITGGTERYLEEYKINCLFLDQEERLWIGTTQGLLRQTLHPSVINSYRWPVEDISNDGYLDGIRYKDRLYLSRYSRDVGMVVIDTGTMEIIHKVHFNIVKNLGNEISSMEMYHPDTIWVGSNAGLLWFDTKTYNYGKVVDLKWNTAALPAIHVLRPAREDGFAWMCGILSGQVVRYNIRNRTFDIFNNHSNPPLPFEKIKDIVYDAYGDVWISGHSLARWNSGESRFDTLITVYGGANKYNDDINIIVADTDGSLWLHNSNNGLLEYQISKRTFVPYTMKDGLPSDVLRCFSPVIDHTLWIGSHNHLTRFNTKSKKIQVYGYQDGLPDQKPTGREIVADHGTNQLYMFYHDEVIRFPMNPVTTPDRNSDLVIEEVIVNNQETIPFPSGKMKLGYDENNLSLCYTIIDFEDSQHYQFAYKLNEASQWTSVGEQRMLHLNNLSPGIYTLHLRATGRMGTIETNNFTFAIAAPFWKLSWFLFLCAGLVAVIIYLVYRSRIRQFRQKANVDRLLSQTEMKALHAQMNPHFIFNSLNSIREMILNNENKEASRFLSKFAHLIRVTLDQSGQSFISLRNTIDYLERYIEMEKIRNSNFNFEITVDPVLEIDETTMPPMLIQPFIENAIWHGTTGKAKKIDIHVHFKKVKDELVCIVEDNGIGIEHSLGSKNDADKLHQSVGINNIRSRIQLLNKKHNLQSSVLIEDKSSSNGHHDTGTRITLRLPLEIVEE